MASPFAPWRRYAVAVLLGVSALRPVAKYLPHPDLVFPVVLALCVITTWAVLRQTNGAQAEGPPLTRRLERVFHSSAFVPSLLAVAAAVALTVYPIADARKAVGLGSTADDAMIQTARALLRGAGLYSVHLYDGAPISPGPGWILLNAPVVWLGAYPLLAVLHAAATILVLRRAGVPAAAVGKGLVLVFGCLTFWELLVAGHDVVSLGFAWTTAAVLTWLAATDRITSRFGVLLVAAFVGLVASSRVVFVVMPVLLGTLAWRHHARRGLLIAGVATVVCVGIHGLLYAVSPEYPPLHLLRRGSTHASPPLIVAGVLSGAAAWLLSYRFMDGSVRSWLLWSSLCLAGPLAAVSLGELQFVGFSLAKWEGANYLMPFTPALCFVAALGPELASRKPLE